MQVRRKLAIHRSLWARAAAATAAPGRADERERADCTE
jgi:hypothetical protein